MKNPNYTRVEADLPKEMAEQYRQHAKQTYGMKLATWLKMLMHRDFTSRDHEK